MSVDVRLSCPVCATPYTVEWKHQPILFGCNHQSCHDCVMKFAEQAATLAKNFLCHECKAQVMSVAPNFIIIAQIRQAAEQMTRSAAQHQQATAQLSREQHPTGGGV